MEAILEKTKNTHSNIGTFNAKKHQVFPNIVRILSIILKTPATSANVERANSNLRYIKTDFRSAMSEDKLNELLLLYVYRDIKLDYKKIVDM